MVTCQAMTTSPAGATCAPTSGTAPSVRITSASSTTVRMCLSLKGRFTSSAFGREYIRVDARAVARSPRRRGAARRLLDRATPAGDAGRALTRPPRNRGGSDELGTAGARRADPSAPGPAYLGSSGAADHLLPSPLDWNQV